MKSYNSVIIDSFSQYDEEGKAPVKGLVKENANWFEFDHSANHGVYTGAGEALLAKYRTAMVELFTRIHSIGSADAAELVDDLPLLVIDIDRCAVAWETTADDDPDNDSWSHYALKLK